MSAINPWTGPQWKVGRTQAKREKVKHRQKLERDERTNKAEAKRRDGHRCRFPLCGCRKLGLRLESSHGVHKGMGGDPRGVRSEVENLITLCFHRHQDGRISRHKGTLVVEPLLERKGTNGPVRFLVDVETLELAGLSSAKLRRKASAATGFVELARETAVQVLAPLEPWQRDVLEAIADCAV